MIHSINYFFTKVFDIILYPFSFINEFWGILFLSFLSSIFVLYIYKLVSSPAKIKETKDLIKANILAIRLYKDFWKVIVSSFVKSLYYTMKYFLLNMIPLLLIIPLMAPVFSQMLIRYEMKPFEIGDEVIIKAKFYKNVDLNGIDAKINSKGQLSPKKTLSWKVDANRQIIKQDMKPVFLNAINEINWKMQVIKEGKQDIELIINEKIYRKSFVSEKGFRGIISEYKYGKSNIDHILYPGEEIFNDNETLKYINIYYKGRLISFLGTEIHWLIHYLILMLIIVLSLKKRFGVEF